MWRRKSSGCGVSPAGASPRRGGGDDDECKVFPRGYVPMVAAGGDGGDGERVLVPVRLLADPCIAELLDMAAQQYGYDQPGVLRVPCDGERLRRAVEGALRKGGGQRKSSGCGVSPAGASPRRGGGDDDECKVFPRGYVPMVAAGGDGGDGERVLVPVRLLADPCIAELLDMAAQQYGYDQPGVLRVPCDGERLRRAVEGALRKGGGHAGQTIKPPPSPSSCLQEI
uniref:Auxin responsive protein n=1 Tax=Oryza meridionalis TaxID=40149 RepID=A0A0E0D483_9ORYZ